MTSHTVRHPSEAGCFVCERVVSNHVATMMWSGFVGDSSASHLEGRMWYGCSLCCWILFQISWCEFPSIFPQQFLLCSAKPGAWEYSLSDYTDQPTLVLVEDTIREKLFLHLHKEIPYLVTQVNEVVFMC